MKLKRINIDDQLNLLKKYNKTMPIEYKEKAIGYMKNALNIAFCPAIVKDELDETNKAATINPLTQTDGVWTWSSVLIYYLENYNIPLPDEFIMRIKSNSWKLDKENVKAIMGLPDINEN